MALHNLMMVVSTALAQPGLAYGNTGPSDAPPVAEVAAEPIQNSSAPDPEGVPAVTHDIIVTAQKREERIQDVPIAITVVDAEALNRAGAKNLTELQGVVPGIFFSGNSGYGASPISIRGTAGANTALLDDPVAVYINGVYQTSGSFSSTALFDVATIEIVRGPQGTLQGRNATAGAVLVRTANPTGSLGGYVRFSVADPSEVRVEGAIGGPIGDTVGIRLAASYFNERGWAKNTFNGNHLGGGNAASFRGTIRWQPSTAIDVRLIGGHASTYAEPAVARWAETPFNPSPTGALVLPGTATPNSPLPKQQQDAIKNDYLFALNRPNFNRITDDSIVLDATLGLGGLDLVSITGFDKISNVGAADSDGFARTDREGFNVGVTRTRNFSQELRLQSNGNSMFNWIMGAYYSSSIQSVDIFIANLALTGAVRSKLRFLPRQDTRSYAGFVDGTLRLSPEFALIGGVRHTRETKSFGFDRTVTNFDTGATLAPAFAYRPDQAVFTNTSVRAKATYQPNRDILLYASYSTGFKSGGFNAFGTDPAFDPEKLSSVEAGLKASLFDRRVGFAFAAYTNRYENLQVRVGIPTGGAAISNAADSKIDGFEFEATLRPASNVTLSGNVSYTDARFSSFPLARNLLDQGPFDATGNRLPRTPRWQYYLQAGYAPRLSDTLTGLFESSFRWRSRIFLYQTDQASSTIQGSPVGELGARAGVTFVPLQLSVMAFATNLTNGRSVNGGTINFSYPEVSFNKPRTVGIQLEARF